MNIYNVMDLVSECVVASKWAHNLPVMSHPLGADVDKDSVIRSERLGVEIHEVTIKGIGRSRNAFVLVTLSGGQTCNPETSDIEVSESKPMDANQVAKAFVVECFRRSLEHRLNLQTQF